MAMLLPIMVGLQTAVSVSELEWGDYAVLNDPDSVPVKGLDQRMVYKWQGDPCAPVSIGDQQFILNKESLLLLSPISEDRDAALLECEKSN